MSLLMDALRKAEESKKKAEQGDLSAEESASKESDQQTSPPAETEDASGLSLTPREDSGPAATTDEVGVKLDVAIEFEEPEPQSAAPEEADLAGTGSDLSLELASEPELDSRPESEPEPAAETVAEESAEPAPQLQSGPEVSSSDPAMLDSFEDEVEDEPPPPPPPAPPLPDTESRARPRPRAAPKPKEDKPGVAPIRYRDQHQEDRRKANAVFAAKRPWQKNRRNIQMAGMGIAAVLVLGIGAYFYMNLGSPGGVGVNIDPNLVSQNSFNQPQLSEEELEAAAPLVGPAASTPAPSPDNNIAAVNDQTISQVVGADEVLAPQPEPVLTQAIEEPEPAATLPAVSNPIVAVEETEPETTAAAIATEEVIAAVDEADAAPPENLISFQRRATAPALPEPLRAAYAAYSRGDLAQARQQYQQTLVDAPLNRNALLGMAAIAAAENNRNEAMELYSRLLTRDPSDPVARAGLLGLMPNGSPGDQERELRLLMERHPAVPAIAFALGNFYAAQQRWSSAQQYYFNALSLAKTASGNNSAVNPDYAFNLAVSLEHLNQWEPARNYYQEALQLATTHPASFDLAIARSRLDNLSRSLGP